MNNLLTRLNPASSHVHSVSSVLTHFVHTLRLVASDKFVTNCNHGLVQSPPGEAEEIQVLNEGNKYDI